MKEHLINKEETCGYQCTNLYYINSIDPDNELFKKYRALLKLNLLETDYWIDNISGSEVVTFDYEGIEIKLVNNWDDNLSLYFTSPYELDDFLKELNIPIESKSVLDLS